jgi:hypothetical protein
MLFVVSELVLCWKGQGKLHIRVCCVQAKGGSLLLPLLTKARSLRLYEGGEKRKVA